MGPRRKVRIVQLKKKPQASQRVNIGLSARCLRQDKLGAVIFGCKHHTFRECVDNLIFGLPAIHFSYVKNITPGLPLFLFNYSDRTLHGIFEATTYGQMKIDSHAWTSSEGSEITPYAAQVRVKVRNQCQALTEAKFRPVIADNYYEERLFWFELNKRQADNMIKLFLSPPTPQKDRIVDGCARYLLEFVKCSGTIDANLNASYDQSHAFSAHVDRNLPASEKKWSDLFKSSSSSISGNNSKGFEMQQPNESSCTSDQCDLGKEFVSSSQYSSEPLAEVCADPLDVSANDIWEERVEMNHDMKDTNKFEVLSIHDKDGEYNYWDVTEKPFSQGETCSVCPAAQEAEEAVFDIEEKSRHERAFMQVESAGRNCSQLSFRDATLTVNSSNIFEGEHMDIQTSAFSVVMKLMQELEGLKVSHLNQRRKVDFLEYELVRSKLEIDQLKRRCSELESYDVVVHLNKESLRTNKCVFMIGGFDGSSWLQDLNSYYPSEDNVKSLCPMSSAREYASVASLKDELYIFGGMNDGVWNDTVECYNPMSNLWVQRPSLNKKKGGVAGASMHDTIFALGGGNGSECFAEVEIFNLNTACWMLTKPMLEKRFAAAAVEMNGALYVTGGYDGKNYLRSVERFDIRESAWTSLGKMKATRGGHSVIACKEKLYALGGYNGSTMVSLVEVFESRVNSWRMVESMKAARGYFGSFVAEEKVYVVGGMSDKEQVLDAVECYDEVSGWQALQSHAIGKRCFFSSTVI